MPISISSTTFMFCPAGPSSSSDTTILAPAPRTTRRERQRALALNRLSASSVAGSTEKSTCDMDDEEKRLSNDGSETTLVELQSLKEDKPFSSCIEMPTQPLSRSEQIHASWLNNTGLDINDEAKNGPAPHCTVEELTSAMDSFFGSSSATKTKTSKKSSSKEDQRKRRFVDKVKQCKWMA
ncbi:hypothetical protein BCV69DRAFT_279506 [Microstroma glucosiphilum]|uniref:Uncharacterized protein n=1 Tax=Pseudomicrostroma glucosiphilum TaxID=1684307 RepID=A0A316UK25_9BASI|nr:hypothetical protein BCV69DRAFT_279506 [Pseudomicrostroma glucosiphilum]PWN23575.1 hypothetical protein BCV69DRAFT_279506 [Pseudomicrostroma glucosiphilum]